MAFASCTLRPAPRESAQRVGRGAAALAVLLAASTLAACSSSSTVERRELGLNGRSGERWELVMAPGESAAPGDEYSRLDGALAARSAESAYPLDRYPRSERSLDRARWLYVPSTPGTWLYFSENYRNTWHR